MADADTKTLMREALDNMFETATNNGKDSLEVTPAELKQATEVEGKTHPEPLETAQHVLHAEARDSDEINGTTIKFSLPR
ncbi:hypothetical protein J4E08_15665 [Sagittula sp. NFXS13]|uniref:hypothetical protein n=1 Tax=Sagittula sp. NFXS13 TaxID=2819095 RepID=UPI0032DEE288